MAADRAVTRTRVAVVIVDGLPLDLAERVLAELPYLGSRLVHGGTAISCFPSTTGPAYFPFLAGCTPGRANVPGIRWLDRTRPTRTYFPHRGLRSYVGPDARRLSEDTKVTTLFARHAWPASSPIPKDVPKHGEKSRDAIWAAAHLTHGWEHADRRTAWKLGRALRKQRSIAFAVFPSVDELGHVYGIEGGRPEAALREIDRRLARTLDGFEGDLIVSADHGLTDTHTHIDLRALVEELVGPTLAFPLIAKRHPEAVVCESGNAMANVYVRAEDGWAYLPSPERCRELAVRLLEVEGIDSVAIRGGAPDTAELWTSAGAGEVGFDEHGLYQRGPAFRSSFEWATPAEALARSAGEDWPDAAFALTALFASERTGDLLISAKPGFDLRAAREWPEHHASHGALHRAHTVVPVLSTAPLPSGPLRTLDIFCHTLDRAGIPLEEYPESDAARLAHGEWRPEVWR